MIEYIIDISRDDECVICISRDDEYVIDISRDDEYVILIDLLCIHVRHSSSNTFQKDIISIYIYTKSKNYHTVGTVPKSNRKNRTKRQNRYS
jgi:hypothetical protein